VILSAMVGQDGKAPTSAFQQQSGGPGGGRRGGGF
jgi:hypothetical protein